MFVRSMLAAAIAAVPMVLSYNAAAQTPASSPPAASAPEEAAPNAQNVETIVVKGAFLANDAASALKFDVPVRDIPMTTSNYSASFTKAIETSNIGNLYAYMTGVQRSGNTGTDLTLRGFKAAVTDRNTIMTDGLPGATARFSSQPTIALDHVEVVKGPASVLYGSSQPGGFVNTVQKKPKADFEAEIDFRSVAYASTHPSLRPTDHPGFEGDFDVTGPLNADASLMGRFIVSSIDNHGFRDNSWDQEQYVAPSLTYKPNGTTTVTFLSEYRHNSLSADTGLVAPNNNINQIATINTRYAQPNDFQLEWGRTYVLIFDHSFDNGMKLDARVRSVRNHDNTKQWEVSALPAAGSLNIPMRARNSLNKRTYDFADTSLLIPVDTGPLSHKILAGVNGGRETSDANRAQFDAAPGVFLNVNNPAVNSMPPLDSEPLVLPSQITQLNDRTAESLTIGPYASDLITIGDHWKANLGWRWTHDKQKQVENRVPGVVINQSDTEKTLPMGAVMFQPSEQWTFYTSYTTSYVPPPSNAVDANNVNSFKPTSAKQYEVGAKADLLNSALTGTIAIFDIIEKDVLTTYTVNCPVGTCTLQQSGQEAKGIEAEINWRVVDGWQLTAGYSHTDSKLTNAVDPVQTGFRAIDAPLNNAHLWSRYDIQSGPMTGLGFGLGWVYVSQRTGTIPTTASNSYLVLPSYQTTDFVVYYVVDRYDFTFKVGNAFDRHYYESAGASGAINIYPGMPRNVALSFRAHF